MDTMRGYSDKTIELIKQIYKRSEALLTLDIVYEYFLGERVLSVKSPCNFLFYKMCQDNGFDSGKVSLEYKLENLLKYLFDMYKAMKEEISLIDIEMIKKRAEQLSDCESEKSVHQEQLTKNLNYIWSLLSEDIDNFIRENLDMLSSFFNVHYDEMDQYATHLILEIYNITNKILCVDNSPFYGQFHHDIQISADNLEDLWRIGKKLNQGFIYYELGADGQYSDGLEYKID